MLQDDARVLLAVAGVGSVLARTNPVEAVRYFDAHLPAQPSSARTVEAWLDAQYSYVGSLSRVREFGRADAGAYAMQKAMDAFHIEAPRQRGRLSQLLAGVAKRAGDTEAENRHWQEMVQHMRAADNPSALGVTLNNWAIHLGRTKKYQASEAAFREALSIYEQAGLEDPTYATVLRSYAGLLFRTGRVDEAIAATEKALSLLSPTTQFYARFVAELNLAQYTFVKGDVTATVNVMERALAAARKAFADDPSVPRRMARLFAKTMFFGGAYDLAALSLGYDDGLCRSPKRLGRALEALESSRDQASRKAIWTALRSLEDKRRTEAIGAADLAAFLKVYEDRAPAFFDALDHWRVLNRVQALTAVVLPEALTERYEALESSRRKAETLVRTTPALVELAQYLQVGAKTPPTCPK